MIDSNLQHCFLRALIQTNANTFWLDNCNFVNINTSTSDVVTCLFLSDDRKSILYVTNKVHAVGPNGLPWSQQFNKILLNVAITSDINSSSLSYSGLFFCEARHDKELFTFKEYMQQNAYNFTIIVSFLETIRNIIKFHLLPFCFSEDLFLVDSNNKMYVANNNYILSLMYPLPEEIVKTFKQKLHPTLAQQFSKEKTGSKKSAKNIAKTGMFSPLKMKKICTKIIEKEASEDCVYFLSSIIYYFACVGTCWKLQRHWVIQSKGKRSGACTGICSYALNFLGEERLKDIVHNYICIEIVQKLPQKLRKSDAIYPLFLNCLSDLENYLRGLYYSS